MERQVTIDAVRGFAVLGILLMNIVSMGLPGNAYVNPMHYGGHTGADLWAWLLAHIFVDGKMRALFTMLFGASMLLIADRAEGQEPGPAAVHYRRVFWLFVIGMIHCWLIWYGDILVTYALAGAIVFLARRWPPHRQAIAGIVVLLLLAAYNLSGWWHFSYLQDVAASNAPGAADAREALAELSGASTTAAQEIVGYRGRYVDVLRARAPTATFFQTYLLLTAALPEAIGLMLVGMSLFRTGFFAGDWEEQRYRRLAWLVPLAAGATIPMTLLLQGTRWNAVTELLGYAYNTVAAPSMALGYAAAIILFVRSRALPGMVERLAAVGRMALTNYLGASILATTLFYGYGFGRFAHYSRAELYIVVLAIWTLQLWLSPIWLRHFRFGPFEWLWRSLVRWSPQPMRGAAATA